MKTIIILCLLTVEFTIAQVPGDCLSSAAAITECGYIYSGNNNTYTDNCPGSLCGCVGGNTNPSNFDNDCSTTYPGGNCGSDFAGSIENSMWWSFSPTEDCDYEITISPSNCCCAQGNGIDYMQIWIGQANNGIITSYLVNDNSNNTITTGNTILYTVPVLSNLGEVYIMLDGNAGSECDIDISIEPSSNCTETCPILLNSHITDFYVELIQSTNKIILDVEYEGESFWELQKSSDGTSWNTFGIKRATNNSTLIWFDESPGYTYYRVNDGTSFSKTIVIWNPINIQRAVIRRYNMVGIEISDFEAYVGWYIEVYRNGNKLILSK